jgi:hypothetical protein
MIKTREYKTKKQKRNNSYWFLLPILELNKNELISCGIINCYIEDHLREYNYNNGLLLLFKYNKLNEDLYAKLRDHEYFKEEYDTTGIGNLIFAFKLPDKFNKIIELFKEGKFSKFPEWYKNGYFNKYTNKHTLSDEFKVFMKHEDKRKAISDKIGMQIPEDMEVRSLPLPKQEIYMYNENFKIIDWNE